MRIRTLSWVARAAVIVCCGFPLQALSDAPQAGRTSLQPSPELSSCNLIGLLGLSVSTSGTGSGHVTAPSIVGATDGITCGTGHSDCSECYPPGFNVNLTAKPDAPSIFAGWSGDRCAASTDTHCSFPMTENISVHATFNAAPQYELNVTKLGIGAATISSSPAGITNCGGAGGTCGARFPAGSVVLLNWNTSGGSVFLGWTGCTYLYPCQVVMDANKKVTAKFGYMLYASRSGAGWGSITSSPAGINCGGDCEEGYSNGETVTVTATPDPGSTFGGWYGSCTGSGNCIVAMTAERNAQAKFDAVAPTTYQLTVGKSGTGAGTVTSSPPGIDCGSDCAEPFPSGTSVTLTASALPGSLFAGWSGACAGTSAACSVSMTAAKSVTARFDPAAPSTFQLTVARQGSGSGTVNSMPAGINCGNDCAETFNSGTVVTLVAAPLPGSTFAGWGGACSGTGNCIVSMTSNISVTATFNLSGPATACVPDATALCLAANRFRVQVHWTDFSGNQGLGRVVPFTTPDSGIFWFFGDNNWEMMVKVLNACQPPFSRFWVFSAATTTVQYTLTVTDTATGQVKQYTNPMGVSAAAITDTDAFATCP